MGTGRRIAAVGSDGVVDAPQGETDSGRYAIGDRRRKWSRNDGDPTGSNAGSRVELDNGYPNEFAQAPPPAKPKAAAPKGGKAKLEAEA